MAERPILRALSAALGIEPSYRSPLSRDTVEVPLTTHEALVHAMGVEASSERAAAAALDELGMRPTPLAREPVDAVDVDAILGGRSGFGLQANLYALRAERDAGFGTFAELARLVDHAARAGAAFVGINPLHALASADGAASPYHPESRLHRSALYLDLERCHERLVANGARVPDPPAPKAAHAERIDPAARAREIEAPLRTLHAAFLTTAGDAADAERRAFGEWRAREGETLERYATFCALAEALGGPRDWRRWPAAHRDVASAATAAFRREHAPLVTRHAWIQYEVERQLAEVATHARARGLALGLLGDLALGSAAGGADPWAWPGLFAHGASLGAPPDAFSRAGQDWGVPPLDPHALRADGYAFLERLLDANLRHVGALRIDHALGLRRLFWIPSGGSPRDGAYVRQPEADLFAVVGAASRRHRALIVAEDLGNVPEGFSETLQARGLCSSRVLLFERDARGFRSSGELPHRSLASFGTHDLPPLAAWLSDADLALRRRAGQLPDEASLASARRERDVERNLLALRLEREGFTPDPPDDPAAWTEATTRFLADSPAALVALALDDLAAETEPINLPGVPPERHESWHRRSRCTLEALFAATSTRRVLAAIPPDRRGKNPVP